MANQLAEMNPTALAGGHSAEVISKQLPVTTTVQERMLPTLRMTAGAAVAIAGWWRDRWLIVGGRGAGRVYMVGIAKGRRDLICV